MLNKLQKIVQGDFIFSPYSDGLDPGQLSVEGKD